MGHQLLTLPPNTGRSCASDWHLSPIDKTCHFISSSSLAWSAAESFCESQLSELSVSRSATAANWLCDWAASDEAWVGLQKRSDDVSVLMTVNGSAVPYINWDSGQPDGADTEMCISRTCSSGQSKFQDAPCAATKNAQCQHARKSCSCNAQVHLASPVTTAGALLRFASCGDSATDRPATHHGAEYWVDGRAAGLAFAAADDMGLVVLHSAIETAWDTAFAVQMFKDSDASAASDMVDYLAAIPAGHLVAVLCQQTCASLAADAAVAALLPSSFSAVQPGDSALYIFVKGSADVYSTAGSQCVAYELGTI